jgi:hypothetical protein
MATCLHCTTELTGRSKVCDSCKARVARPAKRSKPRPAAASTPARRRAPKSATPAGLRDRGRALWSSLGQTAGTAAGELALEACRLADRLERIDAMLAGRDDWFEMVEVEQGTFVLRVDNLLDQGRQQALAFKQLLAELGITAVPAAPVGPAKSPLDQLRERREQKAAK